MQYLDIIVKLAQASSSIAVCVGIIFAFIQLRATIQNSKINLMKTEWDIFDKLSEKEKAFVDEFEKLKQLQNITDEQCESYLKNMEQYLNELDSLCLYVIEGYFSKVHFFQKHGKGVLSIYEILKKENAIEKYPHIDKVLKRYRKRMK